MQPALDEIAQKTAAFMTLPLTKSVAFQFTDGETSDELA